MSNRVEHLRGEFIPKIEKSPFLREGLEQLGSVGVTKQGAEGIFEAFLNGDPTDKKRYLEWMLQRFLDEKEGAMRLMVEDISKATEDLTFFNNHNKKIPKEKRNIKNYKSLQELYDVISEYQDEDLTSNTEKVKLAKGNKEVWLDNDRWYILRPLDAEAATFYGRDTRWCTASVSSSNNFDYYNNEGPLIIIIDKKEPNKKRDKMQLHFEKNQFMDSQDSSIDEMKLFRNNPDILDAIIENVNSAQSFKLKLLFQKPINEEDKKIKGDIDLSKIQAEELTPGLEIDGTLTLTNNKNLKVIRDIKVTGDIKMENSSVEAFYGKLEVGKSIFADESKLKHLPDNTKAGGIIKAINADLERIPENLEIGYNFYVSGNSRIDKVPESMRVDKYFFAKNTQIKSEDQIPKGTVGKMCILE